MTEVCSDLHGDMSWEVYAETQEFPGLLYVWGWNDFTKAARFAAFLIGQAAVPAAIIADVEGFCSDMHWPDVEVKITHARIVRVRHGCQCTPDEQILQEVRMKAKGHPHMTFPLRVSA